MPGMNPTAAPSTAPTARPPRRTPRRPRAGCAARPDGRQRRQVGPGVGERQEGRGQGAAEHQHRAEPEQDRAGRSSRRRAGSRARRRGRGVAATARQRLVEVLLLALESRLRRRQARRARGSRRAARPRRREHGLRVRPAGTDRDDDAAGRHVARVPCRCPTSVVEVPATVTVSAVDRRRSANATTPPCRQHRVGRGPRSASVTPSSPRGSWSSPTRPGRPRATPP